MSYEVLARKWRPQVFEDVVGQAHVTKTLVNAIKADRIAHAYLFCGPRGVGKTTVARILAKAINCEKGETGIPCNTCSSCVSITDGSSVDVQEIDGASNRRIEEIRELREHIKYMPSSSRYRVYIIDEVHMLTKEAFNALLKTLEEPPAHAKFIFATTEIRKVPATILSRCQRFDFKRISPFEILKHLRKIALHENIEVSDTGLGLIAGQSEGSMRDAQSLFDQVISFCGQRIKDEDITEILGIIDREIVARAVRSIMEGSPKECLSIIEQVYVNGYDLKEFYRILMQEFRDIMLRMMGIKNRVSETASPEQDDEKTLPSTASIEKIQFILNFFVTHEKDLLLTSTPRLFLETLMVKLCHIDEILSFDEIIKKIEDLERRLLNNNIISKQTETQEQTIKETSVQWEPSEKIRPDIPTNNNRENKPDPGWDDFIAYVSSVNRPMSTLLRDMQVKNLTEKSLELQPKNGSFALSYFDDKECYQRLYKYCKDFFKRDIKPNIVLPGNTQKTQQTDNRDKDTTAHKAPEYPDAVQQILTMFDGSIEENKPG